MFAGRGKGFRSKMSGVVGLGWLGIVASGFGVTQEESTTSHQHQSTKFVVKRHHSQLQKGNLGKAAQQAHGKSSSTRTQILLGLGGEGGFRRPLGWLVILSPGLFSLCVGFGIRRVLESQFNPSVPYTRDRCSLKSSMPSTLGLDFAACESQS